MEKTYTLAQIAMMTGFTDRTLRNYLKQGLLEGEKINGAWQFSAEAVDAFFAQPFVKESLRIKRSAAVFDFMGEKKKKRIDAQRRIMDIEDIILKEYLDLKRGTNDYHTGLTQELY